MQLRNSFNSSQSSLKDSLSKQKNQYSSRTTTNNNNNNNNKNNNTNTSTTNNTQAYKSHLKYSVKENEVRSNSTKHQYNTNYNNKYISSNLITSTPKESLTVNNLIHQQIERGRSSNMSQTTTNFIRPISSNNNNSSQRDQLNSPRQEPLRVSSSVHPSNKISTYSTLGMRNPNRFLPEKPFNKSVKKTLILDLDETLVHSAFKASNINTDILLNVELERKMHVIHVLKRPGAEEFLERMSKLYEVVIFTASLSPYANPLIDQLDLKRCVDYRLFREHCTAVNGMFIKDMKKLGRDLKDVIIVDNNPVSFAFNPENGIPCKTWYNDKSDKELFNLVPVLEYLSHVTDVRDHIKKFVIHNEINYKSAFAMINDNSATINNREINLNSNNYRENNFIGNTTKNAAIHLETPSPYAYKNQSQNLNQNLISSKNSLSNNPPNISINIISHNHSHIYLKEGEKKIEESKINNSLMNSPISNTYNNKYNSNQVTPSTNPGNLNLFNKSSLMKDYSTSKENYNYINVTPTSTKKSTNSNNSLINLANTNSNSNKYSSLINSNSKYNSNNLVRPSSAVTLDKNENSKNSSYQPKYEPKNYLNNSSSSFSQLKNKTNLDIDFNRNTPLSTMQRPLTSDKNDKNDKNVKNNINNLMNSMNTPKRNLTPSSTSSRSNFNTISQKNKIKNNFDDFNSKNKIDRNFNLTSRSVDRSKNKITSNALIYRNENSYVDRNNLDKNLNNTAIKLNNSYFSNSNTNKASIKNLNPYNYSYNYNSNKINENYSNTPYRVNNILQRDNENSNSNSGIYSQSVREKFYENAYSRSLYKN